MRRAKHPPLAETRQSSSVKIFHFTEIRNCGILSAVPAREEGRSYVVTNVGRGAVDAAVPGTRRQDQGEMNLVRALTACGTDGACVRRSPWVELDGCVRRKRVVLTVVATVSLAEMDRDSTGFRGIANSRGDGGQKELGSGESAHKPSDHRAGKAGCFSGPPVSRLRICVCKFLAQRIMGVSRHPAFPAPSSRKRTKEESKTRAFHAARMPLHA
ncbi:hypothetical protein ABIB99_004987 [Bradyrhizobium sp. LA6.1]